jgi:hypothetical protein
MQKNTATKWIVFAWTTATNLPKTGDAAQITGSVRIDGGADNAIDDTNPAELAGGYYVFDITAAECNGDNIVIIPASSTAGVQVIGVPGAVWTNPAYSANGNVKASLVEILTTALTETSAGYLSAGVKKLFDVATPVLTAASVNQTGDGYAIVNNGTYGNSALHTEVAKDATVSKPGTAQTITANQAVNAAQFGGQTVTAAGAVTVLASVGTAATATAQTGDVYPLVNTELADLITTVGVAGAGLTSANIGQAALVANNLDHLLKTATAAVDMTTEVTDGTVISRIISNQPDGNEGRYCGNSSGHRNGRRPAFSRDWRGATRFHFGRSKSQPGANSRNGSD